MLLLRASSPYAAMDGLRRQLAGVFDDACDCTAPTSHTTPAMNLWDEAEALVAEVDVPGMRADDIEIQVHGRQLTIKGKRELECPENARCYRQERVAGSFERSLTLPVAVEVAQVKATLKDGVLTLRLPKVAEAKSRKIEIEGL